MFEKLVVSTIQQRKHTTAKFFVGTLTLYAVGLAGALVVSVVVSDPRLADDTVLIHVAPLPLAAGAERPPGTPPRGSSAPATRPDPRHPMELDQLLSRRDNRPPTLNPFASGSSDNSTTPTSGGPFLPGGGVPFGAEGGVEPPPRPDPPPQPKPVAQTTIIDNKPLHVASVVLQGKAITRVTPIYPHIARQIRLQGDVSVEVMISPEGRVESARVVSGHLMLAQAAREAALGWRFGPTVLNGVPVRVTGVIVFVFKLTD